ncbi:hypothetical protein ACNKHP_20715 [Shigella boydii]
MSIYKFLLPLNTWKLHQSELPGHSTPNPVFVFIFWRQRLWFNAASDSRTCPTNGQKNPRFVYRLGGAISCTINHVQSLRELYTDVIEVLLGGAPAYDGKFPSQYQPEWQCWGT